ncbi:MAG: hypothetical protein ACKVWR_00090 [Acidimicrobiales bacterium]
MVVYVKDEARAIIQRSEGARQAAIASLHELCPADALEAVAFWSELVDMAHAAMHAAAARARAEGYTWRAIAKADGEVVPTSAIRKYAAMSAVVKRRIERRKVTPPDASRLIPAKASEAAAEATAVKQAKRAAITAAGVQRKRTATAAAAAAVRQSSARLERVEPERQPEPLRPAVSTAQQQVRAAQRYEVEREQIAANLAQRAEQRALQRAEIEESRLEVERLRAKERQRRSA